MTKPDPNQQADRSTDTLVTLTQNLRVEEGTDGGPVVGYRIRKDVAAHSGLLSGLAEADGMASLPGDISPEDVQLWQVARRLGVVPNTDELVTILKVRAAR